MTPTTTTTTTRPGRVRGIRDRIGLGRETAAGGPDARGWAADLGPLFDDLRACPPLSRDEEYALAQVMRDAAGSRASRAAARDALIRHNARLVPWIARRFRGLGADPADLVGWGMVALARAVDAFDPDRGVKVASYAAWHVRGAIQHSLASWLASGAASLDESIERSSGLAEPAAPAGPRVDLDDRDDLDAPLRRLAGTDPTLAGAVRLRFGLEDGRERTYREVAEAIGGSHEWARARVLEGLARLRVLAGAIPAPGDEAFLPHRPRAGTARAVSSAYRGVARTRNGRWKAQIEHGGRRTNLGRFPTEEAAARAYDAAALRIKGPAAKTNFSVAREASHVA